jgi:hypothetical protein
MNKIPSEIQQNLYNLVQISSEKGTFEDWITELLEWNSIFFFSRKIEEDVWRSTKELIENRISTLNKRTQK